MPPSYIESYRKGKLTEITDRAFGMLGSCCICPRKCRINRLKNEKGFCKTGIKAKVCSFMPHHGEEPPISGENGSGIIFFSNCNMSCVYCQNYNFSQLEEGGEVNDQELAEMMLKLQDMGCHNINLATPTHVTPQILKGLLLAIPRGLKIPLVYNTSGYELSSAVKLLHGIIDVYLLDMRYSDAKMSLEYSNTPDYPLYNQKVSREMHRQVGIAKFDAEGIITQGLIIRHLVLPDDISGTQKTMEFISRKISRDTYISLMSQYMPYYQAKHRESINRRITLSEYKRAQDSMYSCGLYNGWTQESFGLERFAGVNIKPNY